MIHTNNKEKYFFEINKNEDDFFYLRLKNEKSKILLKSLIYTHKTDCQKWIKSVIRNSKNEERFDVVQGPNKRWFIWLNKTNAEVLAICPSFDTEKEARNFIEDLKCLSPETPVIDNTKKTKIMKKEELAQLLDGRQIGDEMTDEEELQAEKNGLLVCFGYFNDLLELRGIINNRAEVYEGGCVLLYKNKDQKITFLYESDYDELSDIFDKNGYPISLRMLPIKIQWCPEELDCSWLITTDIPHATFDIYYDEELYCRGIVLEISDIENYLKN